MIFVLSMLIVQFTQKAMTEIAVEAHYADRERLRITAYGALETTLAVLADVIAVDGSLTAPAQGWAEPLVTAGFEAESGTKISVSYSDESGKLPLAGVDEGTLLLLFDRMGLSTDDALHLTQSLMDWIDKDNETRLDGAEDDVYGDAEWPYHASNEPLRRLNELAVVEGVKQMFFDEAGRPNDLYHQFEGAVSLYSTGSLNANSASELALRAYAGFTDQQLDSLHEYLAGPDQVAGTDDDRFFTTNDEIAAALGQTPDGTQLTAGISVLRIHIEVQYGVGRFALEAVVRPETGGGGGGSPTPPAPRPGRSNSRAKNATAQKVSYPFVFLELTEDVGQNASIAGATAEPPTSSSIPPATKL